MRTYLECLRRTPERATHRVVIQDDAWPCLTFRERALEALAQKPGELVAFFVPGVKQAGARRVREANYRGESWADIGGTAFTPVVALAWPRHLIAPFIAFATSPRIAARHEHDDPVVGMFVKQEKLSVWATVPSLVQHPDREPSLIGRQHGAGKYAIRVAALYVGDEA